MAVVYLTVAYVAVWVAVFAYIFKLASDSRRLQQQLNSLEEAQRELQKQVQPDRVGAMGSAD